MFNVFFEKDGKPDYVVVFGRDVAIQKVEEFRTLGYKNVCIGQR